MIKMDLSIIIPVYNEEGNIKPLYNQLSLVLRKLSEDYEIIFVDDGSTDRTLEHLYQLHRKDEHICVIQFQRNFGKAAALMAGFKHARGNIIITMDGDLQDDPKEIPRFIRKIKEGYDLVSGWKFKRKDPITKTIPSKFFNWLTATLTKVRLHDMNCGFKAYRKEVVQNLRIYGELHRYVPVLAYWKGYKIGEIKVHHHPRVHGRSKYGVERLIKGFLDLITVKYLMSYTDRPLHFFGPIGLLSTLAGFIIGLYIIILRILTGSIQARYPLLLMGVLLIVIGVQFISLGLLGELIVSTKSTEDNYLIKKIL